MIILHYSVDDFNGHVTAARTVALDMGMSLDMLNNHARVQAKEALQEHAYLESPLFPSLWGSCRINLSLLPASSMQRA